MNEEIRLLDTHIGIEPSCTTHTYIGIGFISISSFHKNFEFSQKCRIFFACVRIYVCSMLLCGRLNRGPFRVPTERNWSKQHSRIRTPRPLVDRFNLGNLHPNKQWWRERRVAPATFMGFPRLDMAELRGGSLYIEQMDSATLCVVVDKAAKDGICESEILNKLAWRAQQLSNAVGETDLAYLFRGFSRLFATVEHPPPNHLLLCLWGRIDFLLPKFPLLETAIVLEGFSNPRFRNSKYEARVLTHCLLLVETLPGWTKLELTHLVNALQSSNGSENLRTEIRVAISKNFSEIDI